MGYISFSEVKNVKKKILLLLLASNLLVATLASALTLALTPDRGTAKLEQLSDLIQSHYVEDVDRTAVEDAAAAGMVAALGDRWSYYIPASDYAAHVEQMQNAYVGVGITIVQREDGEGFDIMSVEPNGPALEAGICVGDRLIGVEDMDITGMSASEVRGYVRGEEGTYVTMTVLREGREITLEVERREIQTVVAEGKMVSQNTGLVSIYNFDSRCADESIAVIEELRQQGAQKLIFDVRNNGGGYAHEMVELLDYLLPEGDLFRTVNYKGDENVDTSDAKWLDMPMAVLVNSESYSAAEFFAAALSEYEAATVVGTQTSGKGYFQNTFQLNDGSAVGLSTGKYFTPQGNNLEGVGITPDVVVEVDQETEAAIYYGTLTPEEDPQIQAAVAALKE